MSFLSDPLWDTVIGVFVTVLVAVFVYLKQKNRKEIVVEIISDALVLSVGKELKDRVQVIYGDKYINDARLIVLRILNSGNVPILPSDYIEPIKFKFSKGSEILDTEVLYTEPS